MADVRLNEREVDRLIDALHMAQDPHDEVLLTITSASGPGRNARVSVRGNGVKVDIEASEHGRPH